MRYTAFFSQDLNSFFIGRYPAWRDSVSADILYPFAKENSLKTLTAFIMVRLPHWICCTCIWIYPARFRVCPPACKFSPPTCPYTFPTSGYAPLLPNTLRHFRIRFATPEYALPFPNTLRQPRIYPASLHIRCSFLSLPARNPRYDRLNG